MRSLDEIVSQKVLDEIDKTRLVNGRRRPCVQWSNNTHLTTHNTAIDELLVLELSSSRKFRNKRLVRFEWGLHISRVTRSKAKTESYQPFLRIAIWCLIILIFVLIIIIQSTDAALSWSNRLRLYRCFRDPHHKLWLTKTLSTVLRVHILHKTIKPHQDAAVLIQPNSVCVLAHATLCSSRLPLHSTEGVSGLPLTLRVLRSSSYLDISL